MGRHTKGVANLLNGFYAATMRLHQFEAWAAEQPDDTKRSLHRAWALRVQEAIDKGRTWLPRRPKYLRGLTCGARKRSGDLCGSTVLEANGRCKFHGGRSTGPRTSEGKARALENLNLGRLKRAE